MAKEIREIGKKNKIEKELVIKVSKMKPVIKPTKPHRHEGYHELIFLNKGSGYHIVDDNKHEVAFQLNFSDASNFIKFFKSQTTLTPMEYRNRLLS